MIQTCVKPKYGASGFDEGFDGIGGTATTNYEYRDLRASPTGRGPQGFATIIVTGPEDKSLPAGQRTRIQTKTDHLQAFPYTGLPTRALRQVVDSSTGSALGVISETWTNYCDAMPGTDQTCTDGPDPLASKVGITRFVRPVAVIDTTYLISSESLASGGKNQGTSVSVASVFTHDKWGNPIEMAVSTWGTEVYEKKIVNVYGTARSREERLGKVTLSTVTTRKMRPGDCLATPITHTTKFEYAEVSQFLSPVGDSVMVKTLGLRKTIVEPDAGAPIELHTAYEYDRFGNVTKTTTCASELGSCGKEGATGSRRPCPTVQAASPSRRRTPRAIPR